jgi:arylsulfatase A-like enzyme
VLADDMRADFLRFAAKIEERLGGSGRTFSAARANVSLCQPYRVGLLTGQWSTRHKMLGNGDTRIVPHDNTIGKWVQDVGYRTALIGKYLNGAPAQTPKPDGWTVWRQLIGDADPNSYHRVGYSVHDGSRTLRPAAPEIEYLRDEVISFVRGPEPWFCMMTPTDPHYPFEPEPADANAWADLEWETPDEADLSDKPSWYASLPPLSPKAKADFRDIARAQAREVSGLDRAVIAVLDSLKDDVRANTVVIFTSDGGVSYGEHRSPYASASKNDFYEHNQRVPLLCSGPGFTKGTSAEPVSPEADIARTIVEITGATAGLAGDGVDLRDIQTRPLDFTGRHLLHERGGGGTNNPNPVPGLCVSNGTRKLMLWTGRTGHDRYEAYDLDADPNELENWAFDPARLAERSALEEQLRTLVPKPALAPKLLHGAIEATPTSSASSPTLEPEYHAVLIIDVVASADGADVIDVRIEGECIDRVALLASDSRSDAAGRVRRRLMSFQARGTGLRGPVTVTAGDGQTLGTLGIVITEYRYHTAVIQSVGTGSVSPTLSPSVRLGEMQEAGNATHFAVVVDPAESITGGEARVLHDGSLAGNSARFATLWAESDLTPSVTVASAARRWSIVASEIGT